jgi:hypothetical protein
MFTCVWAVVFVSVTEDISFSDYIYSTSTVHVSAYFIFILLFLYTFFIPILCEKSRICKYGYTHDW